MRVLESAQAIRIWRLAIQRLSPDSEYRTACAESRLRSRAAPSSISASASLGSSSSNGQELPLLKASQQLLGTVPVGVPVLTAERCRSVSVLGGVWCAIGRTPEENRDTSNDLGLGLAPVTPEVASSSLVDPATSRDLGSYTAEIVVVNAGPKGRHSLCSPTYRALSTRFLPCWSQAATLVAVLGAVSSTPACHLACHPGSA